MKRRRKLDNLDTTERIETRTRKNLTEDKPYVRAQHPSKQQLKWKMKPTTRRKMIAKNSTRHQSSVTAHYSFISTKTKKSFTKTVQGKQPIKERTLDLDSYGTDKEVQDIIKNLG